ncbi:MAG: hypothetical protein J5756_06525 [Clostridia bacterium]|nr:hypothetical protein [Clostridia bacterium]MBR5768535.1 hypothetical protein [Clostridia bacterium]
MNEIEREFFEEFKHLEKLCCDILSCEAHGVKEYYLTMESDYSTERRGVSGWDKDCRMLKRINYLRNKIAHDPGATDCTVEDIDFTTKFYQRILDREDPLAQLRSLKISVQRANKAKEKTVWDKSDMSPTKPQSTGYYYYKPQSDYRPKTTQYSSYKPQYKQRGGKPKRIKTFVLFLFIIALIVLVLYLLSK